MILIRKNEYRYGQSGKQKLALPILMTIGFVISTGNILRSQTRISQYLFLFLKNMLKNFQHNTQEIANRRFAKLYALMWMVAIAIHWKKQKKLRVCE